MPFLGRGERLGRAWPGHTSLTLRKWARAQPLGGPTRRAIPRKMRLDQSNPTHKPTINVEDRVSVKKLTKRVRFRRSKLAIKAHRFIGAVGPLTAAVRV